MTFDANRSRSGRDSRWRDDAACSGVDPEVFFPLDEGRSNVITVQAKSVCRMCPVREPCLSWAIGASAEHGIWGGFTSEERRASRSRAARYRSTRA